MNQEFRIIPQFNITTELVNNLQKLIKGKCSSTASALYFDEISEDDYNIIQQYLKSCGEYEISFHQFYYTKEELFDFDFFFCPGQIHPDTSINLVQDLYKINGNPSFDYSNYCTICKLGYKQISPLIIKGLTTKHLSRKFLTPFWTYWIVSSDLRKKIELNNLTGVDFLNLYNSKGISYETHFQIKPKEVLKNTIDLNSVKRINTECNCKNIRIGIDGSTLKLKKEVKSQLKDFNELYEHNCSTINGIYIISKKMLQTLLSENILPHKNIDIYPVIFE